MMGNFRRYVVIWRYVVMSLSQVFIEIILTRSRIIAFSAGEGCGCFFMYGANMTI